MVLETIRKGSSLGKGASCEWAIMAELFLFAHYSPELYTNTMVRLMVT